MRSKQERHTTKERISALRILEKNNFNYLRTQKMTGISRSTIKKWEQKYGAEVFSGRSPAEQALEEVDTEMKRNDVKIIKKYFDLRNKSLDRISELIPDETKIETLSNLLKSISTEITVFDEYEKTEDNKGMNFIEFFNERMKELDQQNQYPDIPEELDLGDVSNL
ncbi:MAG: hypothetical protein JXB49_01035 [Bacteroidales bacterium]|nr:hypothetical protein [Bacteroidales bacterium]